MKHPDIAYYVCDECSALLQDAEVDDGKCLECGGVNTSVPIFLMRDPQPVRMDDAD